MVSWLRVVSAIVWKDAVAEWRAGVLPSATFGAAVLVVLLFNVAFDLQAAGTRETMVPGILWSASVLAGVLALSRGVRDRDRGSLDGLLLGPASRGAVYLAKWLFCLLFIYLATVVVLSVTSLLTGVSLLRGDLLLVMLVSAIGYAGVGTLYSAIAAGTRAGGMLLSLLLFPASVPLLVSTVEALRHRLDQSALVEVSQWEWALIGFALLSVILGSLLFGRVVEE